VSVGTSPHECVIPSLSDEAVAFQASADYVMEMERYEWALEQERAEREAQRREEEICWLRQELKTLRVECQKKESTVLTNWKASISKVSDRASVRLLAQRVKEITHHFDYGGPIIQNLSPEEDGGF